MQLQFTFSCLLILSSLVIGPLNAEPNNKALTKAQIVKHWDKTRRNSAIPRDFVIDHAGNGFINAKHGRLIAHGHNKFPLGKPVDDDTTPPSITNMSPDDGATIGSSQLFSARVTDDGSGIKQVSFVIRYPNGQTQSFTPSKSGDVFTATLSGFSESDSWAWKVTAKDNAKRGGNISETSYLGFSVVLGSDPVDPPDSGDYIADERWIEQLEAEEEWQDYSDIKRTSGRIYFEMPSDRRWRRAWVAYVCSGSVVEDIYSERSLILTAAHCIYDDAYKAFAKNVLFIPDQAGTTDSGTDDICTNDPQGCWLPSFGVVDENWTNRKFPDNVEWDHGYYVVDDTNAESYSSQVVTPLDKTVGSLAISFIKPNMEFNYAFGYSYSDDPWLKYCAETMSEVTEEEPVNWWLAHCGLSGGASGGPWLQGFDVSTGSGVVISVNSWGYVSSPGMAGPKLNTGIGRCLYDSANSNTATDLSDGRAGVIEVCSP